MKKIIKVFLTLLLISMTPPLAFAAEQSDNISEYASSATINFMHGGWRIKSFLGFPNSTKHDPKDITPYCEKLIGKEITIIFDLFDSKSTDINDKFFSVCATKAEDVRYKVERSFSGTDSGTEFYRTYKIDNNDVTKMADGDEIQVIGVCLENGDFIPDLSLFAVNNNRLLIKLSDGIFELERITPEYNSIGELGSDGLTDNQVYTFRDGDITIDHYTQALLMIDGTFTSKAAAIIKNKHLLVPLRFIVCIMGLKPSPSGETFRSTS